MINKYIILPVILLALSTSFLGCGGGGGGGSSSTATPIGTIVNLGMIKSFAEASGSPGTTIYFNLSGTVSDGANSNNLIGTASHTISQQTTTVISSVTTTVNVLQSTISLTNTVSNVTSSNTTTSYVLTTGYQYRAIDSFGLISTPTGTQTLLPATAKVGDSGNFVTSSLSDGSTETQTWRIDPGNNGDAMFVLVTITTDILNNVEKESEAYTIKPDGTISALSITDVSSGITVNVSGNVTWMISTIDSTGSVGVSSSIAHDSNNKLHISYYDGTNDAVKYISNTTGTWISSTIGSNIGNVDGNISTSIAVDSANTVHVCYGSYTQKKLIYAIFSSGTWTTSTVDSGTMRQTSIATDSNNKVHISYYDQATGAYKYATNATGSWVVTTIDTVFGSGGSSSIVVDSTNRIHISYIGSYSGPYYDLMYATNSSGSWTKSAVDADTTDSGTVVALTRDSNDKIHISYYDAINNVLKYATNATGTWIKSTVDSTPHTGVVSSIAVDKNNKLHIAYSYFGGVGSILRYAEETDNGWMISDLDSAGNMGFYCSITVDLNNKVHISYWDGIFTDQDLKYATNL